MFTVYPLQAVPESFVLWWQPLVVTLQQSVQDQVRQEEKRLQAEVCRLSPEDPSFFEKLMQVGPGARVFFRRYPFYLYLSLNPFYHAWVLEQLTKAVQDFQTMSDEVRMAAAIPPTQWEAGEYSHDVAEVVSQHDPILCPQVSAADLVPQVMAFHEFRQKASNHAEQQMG